MLILPSVSVLSRACVMIVLQEVFASMKSKSFETPWPWPHCIENHIGSVHHIIQGGAVLLSHKLKFCLLAMFRHGLA